SAISNEMRDLAARARTKKLKPEEYSGGSTSISNLGMMGVRDFVAIINAPQSSIIAIGASEQRPVVRGGEIKIATQMTATLTCDHRVMDGALGAELLAAFKEFVEKPMTMLV
ncbi:MAG: pyruvate dehydrogenase complex dihydrolipoamide acetyltransferase, partial [Azorhizobium sp. 35-67-15]